MYGVNRLCLIPMLGTIRKPSKVECGSTATHAYQIRDSTGAVRSRQRSPLYSRDTNRSGWHWDSGQTSRTPPAGSVAPTGDHDSALRVSRPTDRLIVAVYEAVLVISACPEAHGGGTGVPLSATCGRVLYRPLAVNETPVGGCGFARKKIGSRQPLASIGATGYVFPDYCVGILNLSKVHTRSNFEIFYRNHPQFSKLKIETYFLLFIMEV